LEKHNTGICKHADAAKKKKKDMEKKSGKATPEEGRVVVRISSSERTAQE